MDNFPLVTIVTPTYNRAVYLDETIQSVLSQDYPNLEYIVLDDGSTDNTQEVLEKYRGQIICERHSNIGETPTVNRGYRMAQGEILSIVNSDDPLLPGAVQLAVQYLQTNPDLLGCYGDWIKINSESHPIENITAPDFDYIHMVRYFACLVGPGAFIRRRALEQVGDRDPDFKYMSDFDHWLRIGLHGRMGHISSPMATFRVHSDSATVAKKGPGMGDECIRLVNKYYVLPGLPDEVRSMRREAFSWAHYVAANYSQPDRWAVKSHYLKFFLYAPQNLFHPYRQLENEIPLVKPGIIPRPFYGLVRWGWEKIFHAGGKR